MAEAFAVNLGGGLYLDASGRLVFGPPTGAQIYNPPSGFSVDTKKLQDTFKDLRDLLPNDDATRAKWVRWGVPPTLVNALGELAGAAGVVATALATYTWVLGVMLSLMQLVAGEGGMSKEMGRAFATIRNQLRGDQEVAVANTMIGIYAQFDGRVDSARGKLNQLAVEGENGPNTVLLRQELRGLVDELAPYLSQLRNQGWAATFDQDGHHGRAFASARLVTVGTGGALTPVPMVPDGVTAFDYRIGVPMLLYGTTTYAALAGIAMPWFRSTGAFAEQLRKSAAALDRFVERMHELVLARTEYTADSLFSEMVSPMARIPFGGGPGTGDTLRPGVSCAAGAFDLVRYDDAFLINAFGDAIGAGTDLGQRGAFDYTWGTAESDVAKAAGQANDVARQAYTDLQAATGVFRLLSHAAWLRFLSSPPDRSETVRLAGTDTGRSVVTETPTTAVSPPIFPATTISVAATLRTYAARARTRLTTQPPGYVPALHHRVLLRMLDCGYGTDSWVGLVYQGDVWSADYAPAAGDPRNKRLDTRFDAGRVLSEVLLYDGPSPSQPVSTGGEATLAATTFDWYVPVGGPGSPYAALTNPYGRALADVAAAASSGGPRGDTSIHLRPPISPGGPGPHPSILPVLDGVGPAPLSPGLGGAEWYDDDPLTRLLFGLGERRHARTEQVHLGWQLSWAAGGLEVRVTGRPADRPFRVHVVVEETVYSGDLPTGPNPLGDAALRTTLHTASALEVVNQSMLVPEEFFARERAALEQGQRLWNEFQRHYAISVQPGPGDPIMDLDDRVRARLLESPSTGELAAGLAARVRFAEEQAPRLWAETLADAGMPNR